MMQRSKPVDIEYVLARALGIHATPVPADLERRLPYVMATRTGGGRADLVVDNHFVDIDVWCEKDAWGQAADEAADVMSRVLELAGSTSGGAVVCAATVEAMPYNNPDPLHPDLARVTCSVEITARAEIIEG